MDRQPENGYSFSGCFFGWEAFQAAFALSGQRQPEIQSVRQKTVWQFGPPNGFVFRLPHHIKAA
ncbi:hypothetical protein [Kingella oralis]|uniref:Uncharacterized protein n=1 Tax=Kingella oralis ATCC 51147 TaxID=629741 RepID=C4GJ97_9NEIS|nr:hypothetical protein [Kingella oralis]EEP67869.1 hypothetical protein GCWU000324_02120 [Kingella oralis ATCC 51147]QMT43314.1 hypothetical protein H3L93_02955 [Kingella oralis]